MAKYGIGAEVYDEDGFEGVVVGKRKGFRDVKFKFGTVEMPKAKLNAADNDNESGSTKARPEVCDIAYNVGDRVRLILSSDYNGNGAYGATGEEGVVVGIDDSDKTACIKFDKSGQWWAEQSNIELVMSETWVPTVGDRVRFKDGMVEGVGTVVAAAPEDQNFFDWTVRPDEPGNFFYEDERFSCMTRHFEVKHLAPAPLTIAAGRFYLTRDGRKVGPVVANASVDKEEGRSGESYPFAIGRDSFTAAGRNGYDTSIDMQADLVAEWVEPAPEAAVAEATATSLPNFKVGDRIRRVSEGKRYAPLGFETSVSEHGRFRDADGDDTYLAEDFWELIEPATSPAKFRVGDRVVSSGNDTTKYEVTGASVDTLDVIVIEKCGKRGFNFDNQRIEIFSLDPEFTAAPVPTIPIGSTVTFTATGRLSAINENGHHQVTFPGLPAARSSFALPAQYVALAN